MSPYPQALGIITDSLSNAESVLSDPSPEVLATRFDEDAMIVTARFWYSSGLETSNVRVSAAILACRDALDRAGITLGGATTGLDIVNEYPPRDDTVVQ